MSRCDIGYIKLCPTCEHYPNDKHCVGCTWDKDTGNNTKWELKENPIVIERKVLDDIRAEIEALPEDMGNIVDVQTGNVIGRFISSIKVLEIIDKHTGGSTNGTDN